MQPNRWIIPIGMMVSLLLLVLTGGCNSSSTAESETGAISFSLELSGDGQVSHTAPVPCYLLAFDPIIRWLSPAPAEAEIDCAASGVERITAEVFDTAGILVAQEGPWDCNLHTGTIENVPVGEDYTIVIRAVHVSGQQVYTGEKSGITVAHGGTTDAGEILLAPVGYTRIENDIPEFNDKPSGQTPYDRVLGFTNEADTFDAMTVFPDLDQGIHLNGLDGDDIIIGSIFEDILQGGEGADTLIGNGTTGGNDNALYVYSNEAVIIDLTDNLPEKGGSAEGDILDGIHTIIGSIHDDTLIAPESSENTYYLTGYFGADTLVGNGVNTFVNYRYSDGAVTVDLSDDLPESGGTAQGDILIDISNVSGSNFDDTLIGNNKPNGFGCDLGADIIDGKGGWDYVGYGESNAGVHVDLSDGLPESGGHAEGDTLINIEYITGSDYNDTLIGNDSRNGFTPRGGADYIDGKGEWDSVWYGFSNASVSIDLSDGLPESGGHAEGDILENIESISGSDFNDTLIGDDGNNNFDPRAGADSIDGKGGWDEATYQFSDTSIHINLNDNLPQSGGHAEGDILRNIESIHGSAFNDTLIGNDNDNGFQGGQGADHIDGRGGRDEIYFWDSPEGINISMVGGIPGSGGHAEGDIIENIESITGTPFNDTLTGDENDNDFEGAGGADRIDGGGGWNRAFYWQSTEGITINMNDDQPESGGHAEGDVLININSIGGCPHNDRLTGNDEAQELIGYWGQDILRGNGGNDIFLFTNEWQDSNLSQLDIIEDFQTGEDVFAFWNLTLTAPFVLERDITSTDYTTGYVSNFFSATPLVYEYDGQDGRVYIDLDQNGDFDETQDMVIGLSGVSGPGGIDIDDFRI